MFMKKKFINGLLMAAALFGATSAMVSCKDYEEDKMYALQVGLDNEASLRDALQGQVNNLAKLLTQLQLQQAACRTHCDSLWAVIQSDYLLKSDAANFLTKDDAGNLYLKITDATAYLLKTDAADFLTKTEAGATYLKITDAFKYLTKEDAKDLFYQKSEVSAFISDLLNKIGDLAAADQALQGAIDAVKAEVVTDIAALKIQYNTQKDEIIALTTKLNSAVQTLGEVKTKADNAYDLAQNALTNSVTAMNIANRADSIADQAILNAANAKLTAENAQKYAEQVKKDADKGIQEAKEAAKTAKATADSANVAAAVAKEVATAAKVIANEAKEAASKAFELATKHESLINGLQTTTERLDNDIKALDAKINKQKQDLEKAIKDGDARLEVMVAQMFNHADSVAHAALEKAIANEANIANNTKDIQALTSAMTSNMSELKSDMQTLKSDLQNYVDGKISEVNNNIATLRTDMETAISNVMKIMDTYKSDLKELIDELRNDMVVANGNLQKNIDNLDSKLTGNINTLETNLLSKIADLADAMTTADGNLQSNIDNLDSKLQQMLTQATENMQTLLTTEVNSLKSNIQSLRDDVDQLQDWYVNVLPLWGEKLGAAYTKANDAWELAMYSHTRIDSLGKYCLFLRELIADNRKEIEDVKLHSILGDMLLNNKIDSLDKALNQSLKDSVIMLRKEAQQLFKEAKKLAEDARDEAIAALKDSCSDIRTDFNATISDLETAYKAADQKLADRLNILEPKVNNLVTDVNNLKTDLNKKLDKSVYDQFVKEYNQFKSQLKEDMGKQITSIAINETYNPVIGSITTPLGISTKVLAAYYGQNDVAFNFPTTNDAYIIGGLDVVDKLGLEADKALWEGKQFRVKKGVLVSKDGDADNEGNAGKIYLTLNPNDVDFTGTQFTLINTLNNQLPVTLSPLKKSAHLMQFGWTRAGSANGFYETTATIKKDDVENGHIKLKFDIASLKQVVNDVKNIKKGISATNLATTIYENMSEVAEASALKAQWTTSDGAQKSVVSDYGMATLAVKPLTYDIFDDLKIYDNQLLKVEDLLDDVIQKLQNKLTPYIDQINDKYNHYAQYILDMKYVGYGPSKYYYNDTNAEVPDADFTTTGFTRANQVQIQLTLPAGMFKSDNKKVYETVTFMGITKKIYQYVWKKQADGTYIVNVQFSAMDELMKTLIKVFGSEAAVENNLDKVKDKIDDMIGRVSDFLGDLRKDFSSIKSLVGLDKIDNFIDAVNSHLNRWMDPARYMKPLMIIQTKDGYRRLSQSSKVPTLVDGTNITLWPTTYNVDVLTPAYKKYVACTKVFDAAGKVVTSTSVRDAFNNEANGLNVVIDGEWRGLHTTLIPSFTYEVLYMTVDYHGKVTAHKYYIKANN